MGTSIGAPPPRDYGQETRDTLQAQVDLAPDVYAAEAKYRPLYAQLNLDTLRSAMMGTDGKPGLLSTYENDVMPTFSRAANAERDARIAGEMQSIAQYAPGVTQTLREASGTAPLVAELNKQALADLQSGAGMSPSLANEVTQGVRAAQAARGFGFGTPDVLTEAYARGDRGRQLQNERRAFAGQVIGVDQATGGDPFLAILGRPSQNMALGQNALAQGSAASPGQIFNPESGYAADLYNTNFNAKAAAKIAQGNADAAITAAGISAAGSAASSL